MVLVFRFVRMGSGRLCFWSICVICCVLVFIFSLGIIMLFSLGVSIFRLFLKYGECSVLICMNMVRCGVVVMRLWVVLCVIGWVVVFVLVVFGMVFLRLIIIVFGVECGNLVIRLVWFFGVNSIEWSRVGGVFMWYCLVNECLLVWL